MGGKNGTWGCPKVGFNPGSGVERVSFDGGGGGEVGAKATQFLGR